MIPKDELRLMVRGSAGAFALRSVSIIVGDDDTSVEPFPYRKLSLIARISILDMPNDARLRRRWRRRENR